MPIVNVQGQTKVGIRKGVSPAAILLLDSYSGTAAAYSLRKLRNSYAGSAIQVRRTSDNTTMDIGFNSSGNLDTVVLKQLLKINHRLLLMVYFSMKKENQLYLQLVLLL
jgi:hypothetical protein